MDQSNNNFTITSQPVAPNPGIVAQPAPQNPGNIITPGSNPNPAPESNPKSEAGMVFLFAILAIITFVLGAVSSAIFIPNIGDQFIGIQQEKNEREITDRELIADLSRKVSWLNGAYGTNGFGITNESLLNNFIKIGKNDWSTTALRELSDLDKLSLVLISLSDEFTKLETPMSEHYNFSVSADRVNARYDELFGTDTIYVDDSWHKFDTNAGFYYMFTPEPTDTSLNNHLYKAHYTALGDKAYAYVGIGKVSAAGTPANFDSYRFVFSRDDNSDNYHFETVERLF